MRMIVSSMRAWLDDRIGRRPLFAAAMVAMVSVIALEGGLWVLAAVILSAVLFGGWSGTWRRGLGWLLCAAIAAGVLVWRQERRQNFERLMSNVGGANLSVRLMEDSDGAERFWWAKARVIEGPHQGAKVLWQGRGEMHVAGSMLQAAGNFQALPDPRNPGEFDRAKWLRNQDVAAVFQASGMLDEASTPWHAAWGAWIRHAFREGVTAGLDEDSREAMVIRAVVMGETPRDADTLVAAFRESGTLHVFSVSGLHVAMVGSIGWFVLGRIGVTRRRAVLILLPLIFGYSWITGNSAPALRSAWMAAVFLGAFAFRRKPDLLNALGAVLLVGLMWDGRILYQVGVQLSYGVVAAIAVGTSWFTRCFRWMSSPELYLPLEQMSRARRWFLSLRQAVAQSLAVSTAAAVGSAPLTLFHFGMATPVSLLAGLVLVPLVFVLLCISLLALAVSPIAGPVARGLNQVNALVARASMESAEFFAAIPGGHLELRKTMRPGLLVYALERGAGSACFYGGTGEAVLVDCGDRNGFRHTVMPSLRTLGMRPNAVVMTHPDGHHLGGGAAVWEAFAIREAVMPVTLSRSTGYRSWMANASAMNMRLAREVGSMDLPDGARLEVVHSPDPLAQHARADDRVALYRLHWRGWKILFTSDAGTSTENQVLEAGADVSADVIVAGCHRSDLSLGDAFLHAVAPRAIVFSNPAFPPEEHRSEETVGYWKSRGIEVIDQCVVGGVTITVDDHGDLRLAGFLQDEPIMLKRR
jgi:ComEC/Rec2-related protein